MIEITMPDFTQVYAELLVLAMTCVILILDQFLGDAKRNITYYLTQLTVILAAVITFNQDHSKTVLSFSDMFINDGMSALLKMSLYVVMIGIFLYSRDYLTKRGLLKGEYYVLGLFGMLGMMIMISSHNFLTIYLGLELLSLSLYALVAFDRDSATASEAAMKFFVLGAIASGMLLYGMSMLYGANGSLDFAAISTSINEGSASKQIQAFGLVFIVVGLAFKLGAVPFHMWLPDIYHGAPTSVTLYIASAPKIAAFAMVIRLLAETMPGLLAEWQTMLIMLAILSIGIGNVIAIAQTNLKRMLAYSTISHVGFLLLGILAGDKAGYSAAMFYTITYALTSLGAFGMIILMSRNGFEADSLDDYKGLNQRNPWYAFVMLILMFSMAGVPPTVGFFAKFWVLQAVINVDMTWLALVAVFFSVIGAFYYIRIIKLMYFDKSETDTAIEGSADMRVAISLNGILILALGILPNSLMAICVAAFA